MVVYIVLDGCIYYIMVVLYGCIDFIMVELHLYGDFLPPLMPYQYRLRCTHYYHNKGMPNFVVLSLGNFARALW